MNSLFLPGCAPLPLAHYLKALGILRLVSEQCDPLATASWQRDALHFSSALDADALVAFFLSKYQPTPVLAPWNGGSGFYPKDNREAIDAIEASGAERFGPYRAGLSAARTAVVALGLKEKPDGDTKARLLQSCRNTLPEDALGWLDAVFVLGLGGPKYPPLLGTGGNDGRLEFTNNFMQRLGEVFNPVTGEPTAESERWLRAALFATPARGATAKAPIGQFFPGAAGGANGTSGFDAPSTVNPWDFILMIEGALLFAAASVKRLESAGDGSLVYPFCVRQAGVGYASAATADEKDARCEMWMPLWERPTTLPELRAIFSEGRSQVGGRAARNGVDFARAAVTLGVDRGIGAFQRYGFQVRNGLAYFATPLERVAVRRNARADLLADIDLWLDRLRQKAGPQANPVAPASVSRALNQIERSILDLCRDDSPDRLQAVLIALGRAERALARSFKWTTGDNARLRALHHLHPAWLEKAATDCAEFRLAAALAGSRAWLGKETLWLRQHLEPLTMGANLERSWLNWDATPGNDVVWHEGQLTDALNAILARRMIRVEKSGAQGWPDWSPRTRHPPSQRRTAGDADAIRRRGTSRRPLLALCAAPPLLPPCGKRRRRHPAHPRHPSARRARPRHRRLRTRRPPPARLRPAPAHPASPRRWPTRAAHRRRTPLPDQPTRFPPAGKLHPPSTRTRQPMNLDLATLQQAVAGSAAAFRCRRKLQPAGGPGDKVFPPTFAGAVYAVEQRRVRDDDDNLRPEPVTCVVLDTVQSQANRMEAVLQDALDGGRLKIPVLRVDFSPWSPTGEKPEAERLVDDVGKITSLQVPHRLADAILRDSQTADGVKFRESDKGKALNTVSQQNATALYQLCPTALVFGMWDSTGPKGGLGAKFERAMTSEVVGVGATIHDSHRSRGVRRDPLEIRKAVPIVKASDKSWSLAEGKVKGADAPSAINHGSVPFESENSGTTIEYAEQLTTLSLIVLRRLRFPTGSEASPEHDVAGRTVLAALALCAATLAFESGMGLRSRCLLWPDGAMIWELLEKPGDKPRQVSLDGESAIALLAAAVAAAKKAGLTWEEAPLELAPQQKLVDLVRLSQLEATKEDAAE